MPLDDETRASHPEPRPPEPGGDDRDRAETEEHLGRLADSPIERERDVAECRVARVEPRRRDDDPRGEEHEQREEHGLHDGNEVGGERESAEERERDRAALEDRER